MLHSQNFYILEAKMAFEFLNFQMTVFQGPYCTLGVSGFFASLLVVYRHLHMCFMFLN